MNQDRTNAISLKKLFITFYILKNQTFYFYFLAELDVVLPTYWVKKDNSYNLGLWNVAVVST